MSLGPIDFPFMNDGLSYFSKLATAFLEDSWWSGLVTLWAQQEQATVFFSYLFLVTKIFGFRYEHLIVAQGVWYVLQLALISWCSRKVLRERCRLALPFFPLLVFLLATHLAFGFFSALPGNVFDLRADIPGAFFLVLALVSLPLRNMWTLGFVFLAFLERFHNATVLVGVLGLGSFTYMILGFLKKCSFREVLSFLVWPSGGLLIAIALRWKAISTLLAYYSRVQLDRSSDWVVEWGGDGFFSFYPEQFLKLFSGYFSTLLLGVILLVIVWCYHRRALKREISPELPLVAYLLGCALFIFLMLIVNPTRNNAGVLRFALAPFLLGFSLAVSSFFQRSTSPIVSGGGVFLVLLFVGLGVSKTSRFYGTFDYWGIREYRLKDQLFSAFDEVNQARGALGRPVIVGALFATEYNFSAKLWPIYLAHQGIQAPLDAYVSVFGVAHRVEFTDEELLGKIQTLDFLAIPSDGCLTDWIPADRFYREFLSRHRSKLLQTCSRPYRTLTLKGCQVELRGCAL